MAEKQGWKLSVWCNEFARLDNPLPPMTEEEKQAGIKHLRDNSYPKPDDCWEQDCPEYRPACMLGICKIAVCLAGDW